MHVLCYTNNVTTRTNTDILFRKGTSQTHRSRYKLTPFQIELAWATENVDAISTYMLAELKALEAKVEKEENKKRKRAATPPPDQPVTPPEFPALERLRMEEEIKKYPHQQWGEREEYIWHLEALIKWLIAEKKKMHEEMQKSIVILQTQLVEKGDGINLPVDVENEVAPIERRKKRKPKQFSEKNRETQLKDITAIWPDIQEVLIKHRYQDSSNQAAVVSHFERKALGSHSKPQLHISDIYARLAADKKKLFCETLAPIVPVQETDQFTKMLEPNSRNKRRTVKRSLNRFRDILTLQPHRRRDSVERAAFVVEWCHDNFRVDTFAPAVKLKNKSYHLTHEIPMSMSSAYQMFIASSEYATWLQEDKHPIAQSTFLSMAHCKCFKKAKMHVCADQISTQMDEYLRAACVAEKNWAKDCKCPYHSHCKIQEIKPLRSVFAFLDYTCCPKAPIPELVAVLGEQKQWPRACCDSTLVCLACKEKEMRIGVLTCPMWQEFHELHWCQYQVCERDNGSKQEEVVVHSGTLKELKEAIQLHLPKYKQHAWSYTYLNQIRKFDYLTLTEGKVFIQTDFSAQPSMTSQNSLNCSVAAHCSLSCWVVSFLKKVLTQDGISSFQRHTQHWRVVSPATGKWKDQDTFLHARVLEEVIKHVGERFQIAVSNVVIWTDGCAGQYKGRKNFAHIATAFPTIKLEHCFAATSQFKGVHDAVGYVAKNTVHRGEIAGIVRANTAYSFYRALEHLSAAPNDVRSSSGCPLSANQFVNLYVASSPADADAQCNPERDYFIVLDRSKLWDSNRAVEGCRAKYDYRSIPIDKQLGKLRDQNLIVSKYPCRCLDCISSFFTTNHSVTGPRKTYCLARVVPDAIIEDMPELES